MANDILIREMSGTPKQICFADHATDFNPTASKDLRKTTDGSQELDCQIIIESVANNAARQSNKVDLGANRAEWYRVRAALEFQATPTAGAAVELWWFPSQSATAGTANAGGVSGADSAYAGYSSNLSTAVLQGRLIGIFVCTVQVSGTVQICECGMFSPTERYGTLVVYNKSGATMDADSIQHHVVFDPIVTQIQ